MLFVTALLHMTAAAASKEEPVALSRRIDELARCLNVAGQPDRANCLEQAARALVDAERQQRTLAARDDAARFGQPTARPRKPIETVPRVASVQGVVTSVGATGYGLWTFVLADGSQWVTQERGLSSPPHPGQAVTIKRAALGSYRAIFAQERQPVQVQRKR